MRKILSSFLITFSLLFFSNVSADSNAEESKSFVEKLGKEVIKSYVKLRTSELKDFNDNEKFDKSKPITKWERQNTLDC